MATGIPSHVIRDDFVYGHLQWYNTQAYIFKIHLLPIMDSFLSLFS